MSSKYNTLGGYTEDDPEYWVLMAKIIGNPLGSDQDSDDSRFLDESGTVIADETTKGVSNGDS